jgi:hypothetical protein
MKKKVTIWSISFIVTLAIIINYSTLINTYSVSNQRLKSIRKIALAVIEPTPLINLEEHALLSQLCPGLSGLVGHTHKVCMGHPQSVCRVMDQTDCPPVWEW